VGSSVARQRHRDRSGQDHPHGTANPTALAEEHACRQLIVYLSSCSQTEVEQFIGWSELDPAARAADFERFFGRCSNGLALASAQRVSVPDFQDTQRGEYPRGAAMEAKTNRKWKKHTEGFKREAVRLLEN
jgi:hypothetical protein